MRSAPAHLVLIGGLAACTAGPDYQLPKNAIATAPAATKLFAGGAVPGFSADPLPPHWWRLYDDARLDEYIVEGLAANRGLRAADANLRAASFVVREAEAAELPTTTLSASGGLSRALASTVPLASAAGYELGGGLTYPLDLAGGIRRGIEAAKDDDEAAEAARDQVRVAVVAAISRSYLAACSANRTLDVAERVVGLQQQTLEVTERLFNGGRGTAFDVTRAQAAVGQSASAIPPIIAAKDASLFELGALLGRAPADYPKEVADCAAPAGAQAAAPDRRWCRAHPPSAGPA
ncbi:MAG: TolC family protein [Aliidongia sp.]